MTHLKKKNVYFLSTNIFQFSFSIKVDSNYEFPQKPFRAKIFILTPENQIFKKIQPLKQNHMMHY